MLHAGEIQNCWVDATVTASGSYAGGLFGGTDYNSRNDNITSVLSGVISDKKMVIKNNLVLGTVSAKGRAGGMLGDKGNSKASGLQTLDKNVLWNSSISGKSNIGYVHGWWSSASIKDWEQPTMNLYCNATTLSGSESIIETDTRLAFTAKTAEELSAQTTYEGLGWDFANIWTWSTSLGHPVLKGVEEPAKPAEPEDPNSQKTPASLVTTYAGDPKTTRAFTWYTDTSVTNTVVQLIPSDQYNGEDDFEGTAVITANGSYYELQTTADTVEESGTNAGDKRNIHQVNVTNLTPGTTYYYRAGDGDENWSKIYTIKTEEEDGDSFTFFSMTDTQNNYTNYAQVLANATSLYPNAEFILHGGDVIQENATSDYDEVFSLTQEYVASLPTMLTAGNHELAKDVTNGKFEPDYVKGIDNLKSHYLFPDNGPENSKQVVYSFEYGDAYFAVLNSNTSGYDSYKKQIAWLKEDIATTDKAWKIVSVHVGPYNNYGAGNKDMIAAMDELGIDLVLFGHNHVFLRSNPIKDGVVGESELKDGVYYAKSEGTVYYSSGCAGANAGSINPTPADGSDPVGGINYFEIYTNPVKSPTYGAITVTEDSITIVSHDALVSPQIIDTFVITKPAASCEAPQANEVTYNGSAQELLTAGSTSEGSLVYSLDGETYSSSIPTATDAGTYTVWYKVLGDKAHSDSEAKSITVTIQQKDISQATVTLADPLVYNGSEQTQEIKSVVLDGLTVTYEVTGNKGTEVKDDYILTITGTGNFTGTVTKTWSIASDETVILPEEYAPTGGDKDTTDKNTSDKDTSENDKKQEEEKTPSESTNTGDEMPIVGMLLVMVLSASMMLYSSRMMRKRR